MSPASRPAHARRSAWRRTYKASPRSFKAARSPFPAVAWLPPLAPPFRFATYIAFATLFASGAGWLVADQMKESANGEIWQQAAATLLMVHGGAAMLTLMLLGALFPLHIGRAWRARKNRATGIVMLTFNAVLIATAFGLYYLGSEILRPWASDLHIAFGLAMPFLFLAHVKTGRKRD